MGNKCDGFEEGEIEKLNKILVEHSIYCAESAKTNVLVCGRSRSGKSTFVEILKDPLYHPKGMSIFAKTEHPVLQSIRIDYMQEHTLNLNIIDTPGYEESKEIGEKERTNEQISKEICDVLAEKNISHIDIVLICINFVSGLTRSDIETVKIICKKFEGTEKPVKIGFIVCRSEKIEKTTKENMRSQLKMHKTLSTYLSNSFVLFSGAVEYKNEISVSTSHLQMEYNEVFKMRNKILKELLKISKNKKKNGNSEQKEIKEQRTNILDGLINMDIESEVNKAYNWDEIHKTRLFQDEKKKIHESIAELKEKLSKKFTKQQHELIEKKIDAFIEKYKKVIMFSSKKYYNVSEIIKINSMIKEWKKKMKNFKIIKNQVISTEENNVVKTINMY